MDISKLRPGNKEKLNVFLQSVKGSREYYEYDNESEIFVLKKTMERRFPGNFGIVPKTHHIDGEPLEVLVLTDRILEQGTVLEVRPIGIVRLKSNVPNDILIAIPIEDKKLEKIKNFSQLQAPLQMEIEEFLEEFKNLKIENTFESDRAQRAIEHSIELYRKEYE